MRIALNNPGGGRPRVFAIAFALLVLASCSDQTPTELSSDESLSRRESAQPVQVREGYRHFDEFIELEPVAGSYIVESTNPASIPARIEAAGFSVREVLDMSGHAGHRTVTLQSASADRSALVQALTADSATRFVAPVYRDRRGSLVRPLNRLDIQFRDGTTALEISDVLGTLSLELLREPSADSGRSAHRARFISTSNPYAVVEQLWQDARVVWASLDALTDIRPHQSNDPLFSSQYYLQNGTTHLGVPVDINVAAVWPHATGAGIRVAVIDDGVDVLHTNSGGGFAGDLVGAMVGQHYDLMSNLSTGDGVINPHNNDTHGTSVAGIIGMRRNNGVGGIGVSPDVFISAARIFRSTYGPLPTQVAADLDIAAAINWAWSAAAADVINNSWGGGTPNASITAAIQSALQFGRSGKGTVVVFSAGNETKRHLGYLAHVHYPASLSTSTAVISVGSIASAGQLTNYTPAFGTIDVVTPSTYFTALCYGDVVTLDLYGSPGCSDNPLAGTSYTQSFSGTSASAPQVAGAAALLLELAPHLTAAQVKSSIRFHADAWSGGAATGQGKLNAFNVVSPYVPSLFSATIDGASIVPPNTQCTYSAVTNGGGGPASFVWRMNGSIVGTTNPVTITTSASGSFLLDVTVTSATSLIATDTLSVTVTGPSMICPL